MTSVNQVLVISPEKEHHEEINAAMNKCGLSAICCMKFDEAQIFMTTQKFGVVFCHETLPDGDFRGVVSVAKPTPVVVLSRFAEWDHYLAALRAGASTTSHVRPISPKSKSFQRRQQDEAKY